MTDSHKCQIKLKTRPVAFCSSIEIGCSRKVILGDPSEPHCFHGDRLGHHSFSSGNENRG